MSNDEESVAPPSTPRPQTHLWPRLGLLQAVVMLVAVVVALPVAFRSMDILLIDGQARTLYAFPGGQPLTGPADETDANAENFFNIAAIDLDEEVGTHHPRHLRPPQLRGRLRHHQLHPGLPRRRRRRASRPAALGAADPHRRPADLQPDRAAPHPWAAQPVPVRRLPALARADRDRRPGRRIRAINGGDLLVDGAVITTQNQLRDYLMAPPVEIDPARVSAARPIRRSLSACRSCASSARSIRKSWPCC